MKLKNLMMTDKRKISWEVRKGVGYLTFTDPPENLMDSLFFRELYQLSTRIIPKSKVSAIIVSGSGRHFSAGADLNELFKEIQTPNGTDVLISNYNSFRYLEDLNIPVIAAIRGVCIGSGLELAMHCHFRLCATDALLGLPETGFGLIPGAGGINKMISLAGKSKAVELILKGSNFVADEALEMHIADAVFP
ncbi:MAG: enoyl-CoA hydratase/isomerase family protein, partial [Chlorobi bacterium]|nr:enoyl-CoA hydratase/isomerase family protein [Chlorobiota bacterium]